MIYKNSNGHVTRVCFPIEKSYRGVAGAFAFNDKVSVLSGMIEWDSIPNFTVITGRNGAGKTILLDYIAKGLSQDVGHRLLYINSAGELVSAGGEPDAFNLNRGAFQYVVNIASQQNGGEDHLNRFNRFLERVGFPHRLARESKDPALSVQYSNLRFSRDSKYIVYLEYRDLSPAEKVVIDLMAWWHYAQNTKVLILDEPDKHLDPVQSKVFVETLMRELVDQGVQVIMTTHRVDTIALLRENNPSVGVFALESENGKRSLSKITKQHAMFKLTHNMRMFTNFHIRVYVEAHNDAKFYSACYKTLMRYSEHWHESSEYGVQCCDMRRGKTEKPQMMSRRYQLDFHSVGGSDKVISEVDSSVRSASPRGEKVLGILDSDYGGKKKEVADKAKKMPLNRDIFCMQDRIAVLDRHSLESFLYDPVMLAHLSQEFYDAFNFDMSIQACTPDAWNKMIKEYYKTVLGHMFVLPDQATTIVKDDLRRIALFLRLYREYDCAKTLKYNVKKLEGQTYLAYAPIATELFACVMIMIMQIQGQYSAQGKKCIQESVTLEGKIDPFVTDAKAFESACEELLSCAAGDIDTIFDAILQDTADVVVRFSAVKSMTLKYPRAILQIRGHDFANAVRRAYPILLDSHSIQGELQARSDEIKTEVESYLKDLKNQQDLKKHEKLMTPKSAEWLTSALTRSLLTDLECAKVVPIPDDLYTSFRQLNYEARRQQNASVKSTTDGPWTEFVRQNPSVAPGYVI